MRRIYVDVSVTNKIFSHARNAERSQTVTAVEFKDRWTVGMSTADQKIFEENMSRNDLNRLKESNDKTNDST
ncbi:unnamed protein product [Wuchereria bancrofti]|uniref:Uncharacterized protein n=1 Tax=Wuchereria bancrofti TaxID=6293 RepID=A0A3P7FJR0_WUCBA|nr:unnamed protein product [Wuchereria bancrofti]